MAPEAEHQAYIERHAAAIDGEGRRLVVGNGCARPREITTAAGRVAVQAPRVDDRRPGERYISALLPPYMRRSPKVTEVLPLLYLRELSTGDFLPALSAFFGSEAGLSASAVGRLTEAWQAEHERWQGRSLAGIDYVYLWADGVHFNVRLEEDRLCCLVMVGVRPDGRKELVAVQDGFREDTQSWLDLLRDLRERGRRDPELAIGDGALGFWAALREVFPRTREQRCWVHKTANVLAALPERVQGEAKRALHALSGAATHTEALDAARSFAEQFAQWPKATAKVTDDLERLLAFHDFPAEHHVHLRTTNPIESTFATVRLRQRVTKGAVSRSSGVGDGLYPPSAMFCMKLRMEVNRSRVSMLTYTVSTSWSSWLRTPMSAIAPSSGSCSATPKAPSKSCSSCCGYTRRRSSSTTSGRSGGAT